MFIDFSIEARVEEVIQPQRSGQVYWRGELVEGGVPTIHDPRRRDNLLCSGQAGDYTVSRTSLNGS
ncbi:MAG: hypothetical protein HC916_17670 [Coleofasciculaceae cyanobacterium SM2_1_6]|nr:hypothetical protein [Coleofasciculaceae cyanobacterium SM2_1_6]